MKVRLAIDPLKAEGGYQQVRKDPDPSLDDPQLVLRRQKVTRIGPAADLIRGGGVPGGAGVQRSGQGGHSGGGMGGQQAGGIKGGGKRKTHAGIK
jgi:hypothetical protein